MVDFYEVLITDLCQEAKSGALRYSSHYADQMFLRPTPPRSQIRHMLCEDSPVVIEDYPDDIKGSSCLVWGIMEDGRIGHVQLRHPPNSLVVTAYIPAETRPDKWEDNFQQRRMTRGR